MSKHRQVMVRTVCTGTIREEWTLTAPSDLAGDDLHDWCLDHLDEATFVAEQTSDEEDREILEVTYA